MVCKQCRIVSFPFMIVLGYKCVFGALETIWWGADLSAIVELHLPVIFRLPMA